MTKWDGKSNHTSFESKENWIADIDPDEYFPNKENEFNNDFWESTPVLYHATTEDHVNDILHHGLESRDETRGLSNKGVGRAVFTTSNYEKALGGSYGEYIFEIDTAAMKQDGFCPYVGMEPPVIEAEMRTNIAHHIGMEDYYDDAVSSDMSEETVIVYDNIPAKYLTLSE